MSNWHFFQYSLYEQDLSSSRKKHAAYYFFTLLLAISGSWLVLFMLSSNGLHPFKSPKATSFEEGVPSGFSPSVRYWSEEILAWSDAWRLDPILIATVMQIESCGNPEAISSAGAQGLFQVMPYHFEQNENTLDPETNARRGLRYLSQSHTKSGGDIETTLAGYNGGHGQIGRDESLWPDETRRYVYWGAGIYQELIIGRSPSTTHSAWLKAGGWRLCQEAERILGIQ